MEVTANGTQDGPAREQRDQLLALLGGFRVSQAMYVVTSLGIPDLLANGPRGPRDSVDLAQATGTQHAALYRVLRFLAGVGLFDEVAPRQFALTPLGSGLRSDAPGSVRSTTLMHLDPAKWQACGSLLHTVRTGEIAFDHVHGQGYFAYLGEHPDAAAIFQQAMTANIARAGDDIVRAYDFTGVGRLVDVGGGQGLLLATVLRAYPDMQGVLYDQPDVIAGAPAVLEAAGIAERCEVVEGDFFASVPSGGNAYILRQIIHDWDDAHASTILINCRRALGETGKVLVLERAVSPDARKALSVLQLDMEMLVNFGGSQRTEAEYGALFATAGLRLSRVVPLGDAAQFSVFEGVPA